MIGAPAGSPRPEAWPSTPSRLRPPAPGTTWLVALGYTALALAFTWPLALGLARDVPGDLGDSLLNMWILEWGAQHAPHLLTGRLSWQAFWNGNIFHPEPYALALSEHLFAQALQIAPVYALTGNIILCYNLVFLSTFVVSAIGAYLLVRDLTGDWRAGVIAGLVYGFLPYRISQIPHVQIMSSQWMPLALWGFYRYVDRRSRLALAGGTAALVLQNWSCGYYLLFFAPFVPLFAVQRLWATGRLRDRAAWGGLATAGIATVVCTVPFLLPYREVQRLYGFDRGLGEVLAFSANVWSYATAAEPIHLWGHVLRMYPHGEGETFLGVTAPLLALVALVAAAVLARRTSTVPPAAGRRRMAAAALGLVLVLQTIALLTTLLVGGFKTTIAGLAVRASTPLRVALQTLLALAALLWTSPSMRDIARRFFSAPAVFFAALMLLAMWLSLGPDPSAGPARVSDIGLYSLLYDYVPGFTGLRVPARYAMIAGLFLAMTAGYGAAAIARRSWGPVALAGLGVLVFADGAAMPLQMNHTWGTEEAIPPARVYPASALPRVYQRIRALPAGTVVAEFPFGDAAWEIRAVYYAAAHDKPVLNGYSGAFPPAYLARAAALRRFAEDGDRAWQALLDAGTTHVVVHIPAFKNPDRGRQLLSWLETRGARYVESFPEGDAIYEMPR
ncbi:MAG: hypothetical protein IT180_01830 [Acidobacteria bacterium]|nr:hypothetical protein [Acidobacteriota bacterium]